MQENVSEENCGGVPASERKLVADISKIRREFPNMRGSVKVFDTTLRDGEQTPGVNLSAESKFQLAKALDALGVDVIEAGFPASSEGERELFKRLAAEGNLNAKVCGLCRCSKADIDAAIGSKANYIHIFIATSDIHMKHKLKMAREQVLAKAVECTEYVKSHGLPCEFSCEDASRSDPEFMNQVYRSVSEAGADMLNIPDTVGASIPRAMFQLVSGVRESVKTPLSIHAHNDFGLAVANTLAGVEAGAAQVQVTVNGLGERAGNAALEETIMALETIYGVKTGVKKEKLYEISQLVSKLTKVWPSPNKAVVGENAFAHAAGIHVHGVLSHALAYEPYSPESVGQKRRIVFGKLTGTNAVKARLEEMGMKLTDEQVKGVTAKVKELGDKGRRVRDFELSALAEEFLGVVPKPQIVLEQVLITTGNRIIPTASVKMAVNGEDRVAAATGVGPVDAALSALGKLPKQFGDVKLKDYRLEAISGGADALCEVTISLEGEGSNRQTGFAVGPDIIMTSVDAMVNGLNRIAAHSSNGAKAGASSGKDARSFTGKGEGKGD